MRKRASIIKRPELLAPAGNLEKLKIALEFGADAVYFGLPDFSLRVRINQFDENSIRLAAEYCRKKKKKFYVTLNIYAHQHHLKNLPKHLKLMKEIKPDGVIVSDPGILQLIRKEIPTQEIHLSTQANATNSEAMKFWGSQGVKRIIIAREVTLEEIGEIHNEAPGVDIECFVHGAMCMSYSGRCILSKWMTNRSANLGDCAQPCRWRYDITKELEVIDDQKRFKIDLQEDQHGTYFFNSKDLCMIEHVDKFIELGVESLKIEGRAKSSYYVATVVRAYRTMIDSAYNFKKNNISKEEYQDKVEEQKVELEKLSNRGYTTGFFFKTEPKHLFQRSSNQSNWQFVGISLDEVASKSRKVLVHNVLGKNDEIEVVTSKGNIKTKVISIHEDAKEVQKAHGGQEKKHLVEFRDKVSGVILLRKKKN